MVMAPLFYFMVEYHFGITRNVLLIGNYAFKFPRCNSYKRFLQGLLANINESQWSKYEPVKHKLAKVYFCFLGLFLIMQRGENVGQRKINYEMFSDIPLDAKEDNFAVINNSIVCIDYGSLP